MAIWDFAHRVIETTSDVINVVSIFYSDYKVLKLTATLLIVFLGRKQLRDVLDAASGAVIAVVEKPADLFGSIQKAAFKSSGDQNKTFAEDHGRSVAATLSIAIPVTAIALALATVNFFLMQRPLAEMFGAIGVSILGLGTVPISTLAALGIVAAEGIIGLALMKQLNWSPFFPKAQEQALPQNKFLVWSLFLSLLALAFVEVGIAYHREILIEQEEEFRRTVDTWVGAPAQSTESHAAAAKIAASKSSPEPNSASALPGIAEMQLIPTMYQAIIGFLMPWILMLTSDLFLAIFGAAMTVSTFVIGLSARVVQFPLELGTAILKGAQTAILGLFDFVIAVLEALTWPITEMIRWTRKSEQ